MDFKDVLAVGGKLNTLGRAAEVVMAVLSDRSRLEELYDCLFDDDAWVRMRAVDSLEKVARERPDWLLPYIDRLLRDFGDDPQPSIQWHLAELFAELELTDAQRDAAIGIMERNLSALSVDWIVAANCMTTLAGFARDGFVDPGDVTKLLVLQQKHHSKSVVKRATKLLETL